MGFLSPEATNSIAGGNATAKLWPPIRPCKGRILSPEVFWIVVDTILLDEREKLIFKTPLEKTTCTRRATNVCAIVLLEVAATLSGSVRGLLGNL